jgi:hypothetical protein
VHGVCYWKQQGAKQDEFRCRYCYALSVPSPSSPLPHTDMLLNAWFLVLLGCRVVKALGSGAYLEAMGPRGNTLEVYGSPQHIPSPPILSHLLYFLATMMGSEPPCQPVLRKWKHWNYELNKSTILNVYARYCVIAS